MIVSNDSPNKIHVKLNDFLFVQGMWIVRTNARIRLSSPDGTWSKEFNETDISGFNMGRAFGSLVYHSIEKFLKDEEIMSRMKVQ